MYGQQGFVDETGGAGYGGSGGGDPYGIGALITAGAMLYDSHQNRKVSRENTDKTIAAQKSESELAYQRELQMWEKQNLYNSPEAQMQRFMAAGLNPHLIYGGGSSSAGNATSFPQYHPADIQYRYAAPKYGEAFASILPTLMSVGSWMQNMRMGEMQMRKMSVDTQKSMSESERIDQLVRYLSERNPRDLERLQNELNMYPDKSVLLHQNAKRAYWQVGDLEREYQHKWGEKLFDKTGFFDGSNFADRGDGMRKLEFLEQEAKNRLLNLSETTGKYRNKLLEAQSSWSDFDVTNPQGLMQLVLSGIMGMAGQSIRLANKPKRTISHETETRSSTGRSTIRRRSYNQE